MAVGGRRCIGLRDAVSMGVGDITGVNTDMADAPGNHRQRQSAAVDVLRCGQNAGGGVAAGNYGVLRQGHDVVDALRPQTHTGFETGLGNGFV